MISPLDRKLLRDLRRLWMQAVAIGLVLGCGIAVFVMATGMFGSLERARDTYYANSRMADLEGTLVRAPSQVVHALESIPGVASIETRALGLGLVSLPGVVEPLSARLVSLPLGLRPQINDLVLRRGRWPSESRRGEVLVNESFAEAHDLQPGMPLPVLIRGKRRLLEIAGIASSPEFVFAVAPGEWLPEPGRFGVIWMPQTELARALDLEGAFNDVLVRLAPQARSAAVIDALDQILGRHGGRGVIARDRMLSARYLDDELMQLRTMAKILPPVFMLVAVFLLNVTLTRLVATERANIGLFKAFGYDNATIAAHYVKFGAAFCLLAVVVGSWLGQGLGRYVAQVYRAVYRLPVLEFSAGPFVYAGAIGVATVSVLLGAAIAVRQTISIAPAVALAPPAPTHFGRIAGFAERVARGVDARSRMVVRRIVRFPRRAATTVLGIALALALLVMSEQFSVVVDRILDTNFSVAQRMDVTLAFGDARDERVLRELARLPGVMEVEPLMRIDAVLVSHQMRRREAVLGVPAGARLSRIVDVRGEPVSIPADGLTLAAGVADKLGVHVGDTVRIETTDGRRLAIQVPVVQIVQPFVGAAAWIERETLGRMVRQVGRVDAVFVRIDAGQRDRLAARFKDFPAVIGVTFADAAEGSLRRLFAEGSGFFSFLFVVFAVVMAAGVAFSAARVTLAEQQRDLATLRVLGFGRFETSGVLLGELGVLLVIALPLGIIVGAALSNWLMSQFETELFSFPYVADLPSYGRASAIVITAVCAAALWVRRDIDRLDLVAVLKSRE